MDRKDIALSVGGVLASAALTYLIYRLESKNSAANQAALLEAQQAQQTDAANTQAEQASLLASLPSVAVGSGSSNDLAGNTASTTQAEPTGNESPSVDPTLAAILAAFLGANQGVTTASQVATIPTVAPLTPVSITPTQTPIGGIQNPITGVAPGGGFGGSGSTSSGGNLTTVYGPIMSVPGPSPAPSPTPVNNPQPVGPASPISPIITGRNSPSPILTPAQPLRSTPIASEAMSVQ